VATQTNLKHLLSFSDEAISACVYENVENLVVDGIVVNLSPQAIWHEGGVNAPILPWRSSTVTTGKFLEADRIAVVKVGQTENVGGVMQRGWTWFGDIFSGPPRGSILSSRPIRRSSAMGVCKNFVNARPMRFMKMSSCRRASLVNPFAL
jgi:hypothetical protein